MTSPLQDFRQKKVALVMLILAIGMGVALAGSFFTGVVLNEGYPHGYILALPAIRFNDFTDETHVSLLANPYADPTSLYPPTTYVFLRMLPGSNTMRLIVVCFLCLGALAWLITQIFRRTVPFDIQRISLAFFFFGPVLSHHFLHRSREH